MFIIKRKGILITLFTAGCLLLTISCNTNPDYIQVRKQVLDLHDKVMADGGRAEGCEMQFNALLKSGSKQLKSNQPDLDTAAERAQILILNKQLVDADNRMENWMHTYNNDFKGKSDQQTFNYFTAEKLKVAHLDSLYLHSLKPAEDYLRKLNVKPVPKMAKMKM